MTSTSLRRINRYGLALAGLLAGASGCNRQQTAQVVQGDCRSVHGANVCTWGETTGRAVTAFGVTVPIAVIENAPADAPMVWPPAATATIPLPASIASATGFKVMTMYWEAHGHPPGAYLVPHFDFHFNTLSASDLAAIDCADVTKPAQAPAAYELPDVAIPQLGTLVGLCVPSMGMHAAPAAELKSSAFQKTMIVGYYKAKPIFVEPMIARATLLEKRNFTLDVPDVPNRPAGERYPTAFRADYDAATESYRLVFSLPAGAQ